jgi:hypothetical protein
MARPLPIKDDSGRTIVAVLVGGGLVVLGLLGAGAMVWLRRSEAPSDARPTRAALAAPLESAAPRRLDPSSLLADARREASLWHRDAVLVSLSASPLDARGVAEGGTVELTFAKPGGQRISGGAETSGERLALRSSGGPLSKSEQRAGKAKIAPEPNCLFEDAWAAAQRAGADPTAGVGMRYLWSDKHARPVWEVSSNDGQVLRRLDGVSCSILTR